MFLKASIQFKVIAFLIIFTLSSNLFAQFATDDSTELVNELTDFVVLTLNTGSAGNQTYIFRGDLIRVNVDNNGLIQLFQNDTLLIQTNDLGEFISSAFQFLGDLPGELIELLEEPDPVEQLVVTTLTDSPGGPIDEVFSQITLGRGLFGRAFIDLDDEAEDEDEIAAVVRYTRFSNRGVGGNAFGITLGWERELEKLRYGVIVPYDRIDFDDFAEDADSFTFTPYLQYVFMRDPVTIAVGPYAFYNYTFINDVDSPNLWGVGVSGSIEKYFKYFWVRGGTALEYISTDVNATNPEVTRFRYGAVTGLPIIPNKLDGKIFVIHTLTNKPFLDGDNNFASVGGEVSVKLSDAFAMSLGYIRSVAHERIDGDSFYLGGVFILR